jgi:hypothetical protein
MLQVTDSQIIWKLKESQAKPVSTDGLNPYELHTTLIPYLLIRYILHIITFISEGLRVLRVR